MNISSIKRYLFYNLFPYKITINHNYRIIIGYSMNWKNPQDINENINWLKIYGDTSLCLN